MKNKAVFLCGPTAVGKTDLSLRLINDFPIEIINVDSALIYRELNIGSAKPTLEELSKVPHHLVSILSPLESYSVMDFLRDCNHAIAEVNSRNKLPILVGGTMMYYNALMNGISQLPEADHQLRKQLDNEFSLYGNKIMHAKLVELDALSANKIAINDTQRIGRALEVCLITGKPMSIAQKEHHIDGLINCDYLPLAIVPSNRELLQQRINQRFEKMLNNGFVQEVEQLRTKYPELTASHNSMRCVGYRQVWSYLDGEIDYPTMLTTGQAATRQLAKRQITWLRSMSVIHLDNHELELDKFESDIVAAIARFYFKE